MPYLFIFILICLVTPSKSIAAKGSGVIFDSTLNFERSALDGLTLGDDLAEDRQTESAVELEFSLEYPLTDQFYVFFTGTLIDEQETLKTSGLREQASGLERNEIGIAYLFGDNFDAQLKLGQSEFTSDSEWWVWWDESLDAISLEASFADIETLVAIAEQQARTFTDDEFIDPDINNVRRILFSAAWEFTDDHALLFYYLDQTDRSASYNVGDMVDFRKIDESDADLTWSGLSYLGDFSIDRAGEFQLEIHAARIDGREVLYELDDPVSGSSEVTDKEHYQIKASARGGLLKWKPPVARDFRLIAGKAVGSGDSNPDDLRDRSFRLSGLQGDAESFGELFRPELSNLDIDLLGVSWQVNSGSKLALMKYRYRQRDLADEMRDTALEVDPSANSLKLGEETDLLLTIDNGRGIEWIIKLAEFETGNAYPGYPRQTVNFFSIELDVEF